MTVNRVVVVRRRPMVSPGYSDFFYLVRSQNANTRAFENSFISSTSFLYNKYSVLLTVISLRKISVEIFNALSCREQHIRCYVCFQFSSDTMSIYYSNSVLLSLLLFQNVLFYVIIYKIVAPFNQVAGSKGL